MNKVFFVSLKNAVKVNTLSLSQPTTFTKYKVKVAGVVHLSPDGLVVLSILATLKKVHCVAADTSCCSSSLS